MPMLAIGQQLSNLRTQTILVSKDTVHLDTVSIVPSSVILMSNSTIIDTTCYTIDAVHAYLLWRSNSTCNIRSGETVKIYYRVFPFLFSKSVEHKNLKSFVKPAEQGGFYTYNPQQHEAELFRYEGLNKSGSISRGITFGNNQDVFVNSSLNLQLSGKLSDNINILAAITDENIPIQPEGNTQQLQDFDKVFIQVYNEQTKLTAGDFELRRPDSYFMNFYKKAQGALFNTAVDVKKNNKKIATNRIGIGAAVSKGKFSRNVLPVTEGNQGPYRLRGSNNESFIIVLAGTERVFLDGQPLQRGFQSDYVIDYNTAEITFTARQLIRKESRVTVEFEYSEKSYARSLLFFNDEYETEKFKLKFNAYSEQDSKNQPLLLELDSAKKQRMADVGDSIQNAFFPTGDSIAFDSSEVLYKRIDTLGYADVFVFSTKPDSAHWRVTFSNVGFGNGDYVQDISSVNGRVFKWIAPVNGIHQGSYSPVTLLVTPKKQQMLTLGSDVKISPNNTAGAEIALSNYDVNLFSNRDKSNDVGYAAKTYYENVLPLSIDSVKGWRLASRLNYEYVGKDFKPIERFRNVEFEREWNLGNTAIYHEEHIATGMVSLSRNDIGSLSYQLRTLQKGSAYAGLQHAVGLITNRSTFSVNANGSLLNTSGIVGSSRYYKHNADVSKNIWKTVVGVREITEHNAHHAFDVDTLSSLSFSFQEYHAYIATKDTTKNHALLNYKKRYDDGIIGNSFKLATEVDEVSLNAELNQNLNHQIKLYSSYRELKVRDSTANLGGTQTGAAQQGSTKTLLNRIEDNLILWKGIVSANTFYEVGTGQERKLEYYFLQVPAGQGTHTYLGDKNNNGVQDLDEFAIAVYQDQATYVKVFTPTGQYLSTRTNSFNEVLNLNPTAAYTSFQGTQPILTRFSNQLSVRMDKKTQNEDLMRSLNPFDQKITDTFLVSTNSSIRNTLFFNRTAINFGADATWSRSDGKNQLLSGFESRSFITNEGNIRWNITRVLLLTTNYIHGDKKIAADTLQFASRNYHIVSDQTQPKLTIQPSATFRTSVSYQYTNRKNIQAEAGELATSNNIGLELRYNTINTGNITARFNYIDILFNGSANSTVAYEMLEGLQPGKNYTWNVSVQRNLGSSMQLSLNYDGRQSEGTKTIHTGGVQFRAYF